MKKITCSQRRIRTTDCKVRACRVTTTLYGFFKTAYLRRLAVDLFTSKFFNYEKFSVPIKWFITINNMSNVLWTRQDSNLQLLCFHKVLSIKLPDLKNTSILTNRCSVLSKI